jgi:hypothetical protein
MRDARRRMYVGLVMAKRRRDWAREMKVTFKRKKSDGDMRLRRSSQR